MTNKELINLEVALLENIRQHLISKNEKEYNEKEGFYIKELGEIIYELETKIDD